MAACAVGGQWPAGAAAACCLAMRPRWPGTRGDISGELTERSIAPLLSSPVAALAAGRGVRSGELMVKSTGAPATARRGRDGLV
jgi:hypothetical protein